jgi:hypothetical protein
MKHFLKIFVAAAILACIVGCGGSSSSSRSATGRATFSITWPKKTRLVPDASAAVKVVITQGTKELGSKIVARPTDGSPVTVTFDPLPTGNLTATATAYPNANATGTPQATGTVPLVIQAGQNTAFTLTMDSTIATITVAPPDVAIGVAGTATFTATAKDAADAVVLMAPAKGEWSSSNTAVATINSDGKLTGVGPGTTTVRFKDLESLKFGEVTVTVRQGDAIAFQTAATYNVPVAGDVIAATDLDGDGNADVVIGGQNQISVLYGHADGTLDPYATVVFTAGTNYSVRQIADVNGDGRKDIVGFTDKSQFFVITNQGSRFWSAPTLRAAGGDISDLFVGDINKDGKQDVAVSLSGDSVSGSVAVFLNTGGSSFGSPVSFSQSGTVQGIDGADVDGDGKIDLVVSFLSATAGQSGVTIYYGDAQGNFRSGATFNFGSGNVVAPILADLNGDGKADILVNDTPGNQVAVLMNKGDGTFNAPTFNPSDTPVSARTADFNQDGKPDFVAANSTTSYVSVYRGMGAGMFGAADKVQTGGQNSHSVWIADFNKDGWPDLVVQNQDTHTVTVLLNVGH